ncbi:MAG: hypothetical protein KAU95_03710 [Candidatus Aenigmarchaeota archaeon]|nr:hypothetical protein [Candidatus Aenigmarchaeota archaeon]
MTYKHTQIGYPIIIALIISLLILFFAMTLAESTQILPIVFFTFLLALALFYSLTVEIDKTRLSVKFGFGIISKKFILKDIESCHVVKNLWYYGWGIRITPDGWLYNISGLSAIEIQMKNGKKYRIGTDEPNNLEHAITQAIK